MISTIDLDITRYTTRQNKPNTHDITSLIETTETQTNLNPKIPTKNCNKTNKVAHLRCDTKNDNRKNGGV